MKLKRSLWYLEETVLKKQTDLLMKDKFKFVTQKV